MLNSVLTVGSCAKSRRTTLLGASIFLKPAASEIGDLKMKRPAMVIASLKNKDVLWLHIEMNTVPPSVLAIQEEARCLTCAPLGHRSIVLMLPTKVTSK